MTQGNENRFHWLKTFFVHGDFNAPCDFDIFDEIGELNKTYKTQLGKDGGRKRESNNKSYFTGSTQYTGASTPSENPFLQMAYDIDKHNDILLKLRKALQDIHEFEKELDDSVEQLNETLNKKEYQYDTTS